MPPLTTPRTVWPQRHPLALGLSLLLCGSLAWAAPGATNTSATFNHTAALPPAVASALRAANVPPEALALFVAPVRPDAAPWLAQQHTEAFNPASTLKLVTSLAALPRAALALPGLVGAAGLADEGAAHAKLLHSSRLMPRDKGCRSAKKGLDVGMVEGTQTASGYSATGACRTGHPQPILTCTADFAASIRSQFSSSVGLPIALPSPKR